MGGFSTTGKKHNGKEAPEGYSFLTEGKATILQADANEVFYNPAQVINRDLSIACVRVFDQMRKQEFAEGKLKRTRYRATHPGLHSYPELCQKLGVEMLPRSEPQDGEAGEKAEGEAAAGAKGEEQAAEEEAAKPPKAPQEAPPLRVFEGLAASGLRAIRYAAELEDVGVVVANDMDATAVDAMKRNVEYNPEAGEKMHMLEEDARFVMMKMEKSFDCVDLDPYGSPATLLDGAVQTVTDGGMLMITATDMAVLCGNNKEVCWSKYGCYPLRSKFCHELALRILLSSIEAAANKHKRHIVPMLSMSINFYVRVFVRVYTSPATVKYSATKQVYVHQCIGCEAFATQKVARAVTKNHGNTTNFMPGKISVDPRCTQCGWEHQMGGPFWGEPIHDAGFIKELLRLVQKNKAMYPAYDQIHAKLVTVNEELLDIPFFYCIHGLSSTLKCTPPPADLFRSAVVNAGYRATSSHCSPTGVKTDAPIDIIWDIMRCWVKEHPIKHSLENTPGNKLVSKEPEHLAVWTRNQAARSKAQMNSIPRFPPNPQDNWGPKARAMGAGASAKEKQLAEKRAANQGTKRASKRQKN